MYIYIYIHVWNSVYGRLMIGSIEPSKNFVNRNYSWWGEGAEDSEEVKAPSCFINNSVNLTVVGLGGCRL